MKATNKENEMLSSRHRCTILHKYSAFDILEGRWNWSQWIWMLRVGRMNCSCQAFIKDAYTPSQLSIAANLFLIFFSVWVELESMDLEASIMVNQLFLSSRYGWFLHTFPIIDCLASVFDILVCKLNWSQWICKLPIWGIYCAWQPDTDDAYTPSQLLIVAHRILIFQGVSWTQVDGGEI